MATQNPWHRDLLAEAGLVLRRPHALLDAIAQGQGLARHARALGVLTFLFAFPFGMATGSYVGGWQILITGAKVPALFLITLAICAPLLYIIVPILGHKASIAQALTIALLSTAVTSIGLGSLSPVVLVFSRTLTLWNHNHYLFLILLLTACVAVSGAVSVLWLWRALAHVGAKAVRLRILVAWLLIYQFVGSQVAWLLRPFVGCSYDQVRVDRFEGNFYEAALRTLTHFIQGLQ